MRVQQLVFDFITEPHAHKRLHVETPLAVRRIARQCGISIPHATTVCRNGGIGGKGAL